MWLVEERVWVRRVHYQIRVAGWLDSSWSEWFEGLEVCTEQTGSTAVTVLSGWMDQAALHGALAKIRDLGLSLISVTRAESEGY